jgi:hypothetical protein
MLLCLFSQSAGAEWVHVGVRFFGGTEFGDEASDNAIEPKENSAVFTVYANFSTMRRNWPKVKIWSLTNLSKPMNVTERPYLSIKSHDEFDCKERTSRSLSYTYFSEIMGTGEAVIRGTKSTDWYPIEPASITEMMFKTACKKTKY